MIKVLLVWFLLATFLFAACSNKPQKQAESTSQPNVVLMQSAQEQVNMDELFEDLAQSGERTNDALEQLKQEKPEELLDYLMNCFLNDELENCKYNDGSAAYSKFTVWSAMLGGEEMPLETETPLQYWQEWCALAERTCDGGTCDAQEHPVTHRYLQLRKDGKIVDAAYLDSLFADLAKSGERTNAELEIVEQEHLDLLLDYLMQNFMAGSLEGCEVDDGSVGTLQFYTWSGHLGMESIESVLESPQQYWDEWSSHVKRIYDLNGMDFMEEQNYPMSIRYINLLNQSSDGV